MLHTHLTFYQNKYYKSMGGKGGAQPFTVVVASPRFSNLIPVRIVLSEHFPFHTH